MLSKLLLPFTLALTGATAHAQALRAADLSAAIDRGQLERMESCGIDATELERLINLPQRDFDQDFSGGWRPYGNQEGCERATAELILAYLTYSPRVEDGGLGILRWHAGQMLANGGDYPQAIALFAAAKDLEPSAWGAYADGTIAFLRGDRAAFAAAREALMSFTPDAAEQAARQRFLDENPNITMPDGFVTDPPNLAVLDRLEQDWGEPYQCAYSGRCEASSEPAQSGSIGPTGPIACEFLEHRLNRFVSGAGDNVRTAIDASWLTTPGDRTSLVALLNQEGREDGPNAPFAMGYRAEFAEAIASLTEVEIDQLFAGLTAPGPIDCPSTPIDQDPFTDDLAGFVRWAEAQMVDPGPDAPGGAQTLAISRPVPFDNGQRVIVVESSTFTPIPETRPRSATIAFVVYVQEVGRWAVEDSMIIARSG